MPTALITGASSGIGLEFAKVFAVNKNNLILVARSKDKLINIKNELGRIHSISVEVINADLSDMQEVQRVYNTCKTNNIKVDYLINNAGFGDFGLFENSDWQKLEQMIDLNIKAVTKFCHLFIADMLERKSGKILNVASLAAFQPVYNFAAYAATKAYVLSFSEALYEELKGSNVHVTCLCPGYTRTQFMAVADMKVPNGSASPASVALLGYNALMKNRMTIIHGLKNKILANLPRFSPRSMVVFISKKIMEFSNLENP